MVGLFRDARSNYYMEQTINLAAQVDSLREEIKKKDKKIKKLKDKVIDVREEQFKIRKGLLISKLRFALQQEVELCKQQLQSDWVKAHEAEVNEIYNESHGWSSGTFSHFHVCDAESIGRLKGKQNMYEHLLFYLDNLE